MLLNNKARNIVILLCNAKQLSINSISSHLKLSRRMIYIYLDNINYFLKSNNFLPIINKKTLYWIDDSQKENILDFLNQKKFYDLTPNERVGIKILDILLDTKFHNELNHFNLSKSTKLKDQKIIKNFFNKNQVIFEINDNVIKSITTEKKLFLILEIIWKYQNIIPLFFMIENNQEFEKIEKTIKALDIIPVYKKTLSLFIRLLSFLKIKEEKIEDYDKFSEYTIAKIIVNSNTNWKNNKYLTNLFTKIILAIPKTKEIQNQILKKEILDQAIKKFIELFEIKTFMFMGEHDSLIQELSNHLICSYWRIKNNINFENPLLNEIKEKYSTTFTQILKILPETLEQDLKLVFSENEVSYLTMYIESRIKKHKHNNKTIHLLILCEYGLHTSNLLKNQIEEEFISNKIKIEIDEFKSLKKSKKSYDLIFSTNGNHNAKNIIYVSPILTELDKEVLIIKFNEIIKKRNEMSLNIWKKIINNENIHFVETKNLQWDKAIKVSFKHMIKKGIIEKKYVDIVISKVSQNSNYFILDENVIIPHSRPEDGVNLVGLNITLFKDKITFPKSKHHPRLFINLTTIDNVSHLMLLNKIQEIIKNKIIISKIVNTNNKKELLAVIKNIF